MNARNTRIAVIGALCAIGIYGAVSAHDIGEPELQATQIFQGCCHERDCRHHAMILRERRGRTARVWIKGLGEVTVPAQTVKKEAATYPVLCTVRGEAPAADWGKNGAFDGNVLCLFFPKPELLP